MNEFTLGSAIEELAGMEVLCSDKTGTMTLNKLELKEPWTFGKFKKEELLLYAGLALKRAAPDAIDQCIIECTSHLSSLTIVTHSL
jgi:H+-transporting ATPase